MKNLNNEKPTFRDLLKEAVDEGKTVTLRADPILSSTDTGLINKTVFPGIDVLTSPGEAFLRQLGVTFFPNLTGNFAVPSMAEDTGAFYVEWGSDYTVDASAGSANMAPSSLTLSARRVSHTQAISKETLAQTSPGVYSAIVQNLIDGIWKTVSYDLFDNVLTDCGSSNVHTFVYGPDTDIYKQMVDMEASLGGKILKSPAYVITPTTRAKYATSAKMTNQGGIYEDGKINSYPAYAVPSQNANYISFGDWSKACVGQWGEIEIIVDPYTDAKKGLINLTAAGLFDTGVFNKRGIVSLYDPSVK